MKKDVLNVYHVGIMDVVNMNLKNYYGSGVSEELTLESDKEGNICIVIQDNFCDENFFNIKYKDIPQVIEYLSNVYENNKSPLDLDKLRKGGIF